MKDKKSVIIKYTIRRFMESGYSGVLTDDIARGCGVSKATLYSLFPSKEALISECVDSVVAEVSGLVSSVLRDESLSYFERLNRMFATIAGFLSRVNAAALDNLRRNFPAAYEKIDASRRKLILSNISAMITEGKKIGFVLPETDPALIAHMLIGVASHIIDPDTLAEFGRTPDRLMMSAVPVIVRGCLTEEGRKLYGKSNREENQKYKPV